MHIVKLPCLCRWPPESREPRSPRGSAGRASKVANTRRVHRQCTAWCSAASTNFVACAAFTASASCSWTGALVAFRDALNSGRCLACLLLSSMSMLQPWVRRASFPYIRLSPAWPRLSMHPYPTFSHTVRSNSAGSCSRKLSVLFGLGKSMWMLPRSPDPQLPIQRRKSWNHRVCKHKLPEVQLTYK